MPEATATAAATSATTAAATTAAATTATTPAPAWHGVAETDTAGLEYIKNKGWQGPSDVIKSYQGAEKLIGRDPNTLLPVPRADDPVGMRAVYSKLGLPADSTKYDFGLPKDAKIDPGFDKWARDTFHELGLNNAQAKALVAKYGEFGAGGAARQDQEYKLSVTADKQTLQHEWGGGYERMMNSAQAAVRSLGFTAEMVDGLEGALGYAGTMKFFATMGQKLGEHQFVGGDGVRQQPGFSGTMTAAEAKAEWEAMKADKDQRAALADNMHPGNAKAKAKQTQLFKIMYPNG